MAKRRSDKDIEKVRKEYDVQVTKLRRENSDLRKALETQNKEIDSLNEKLAAFVSGHPAKEVPKYRIGCNDCGTIGICTETESKALTKITCPGCSGNNWKLFK